jgi:transposase
MIPRGVEVFVGLDPIDLRWSFDRLSGIVSERLGRRARSGALFLFFGKSREALKILFYDGSGLCIFYKRLDKNRFRIPTPLERGTSVIEIEERILEDIIAGIDIDTPTRH